MIQIDMDMPNTCKECPFYYSSYGYCPLVPGVPAFQKEIFIEQDRKRSAHCPLIEVTNVSQKPIRWAVGVWTNDNNDDDLK